MTVEIHNWNERLIGSDVNEHLVRKPIGIVFYNSSTLFIFAIQYVKQTNGQTAKRRHRQSYLCFRYALRSTALMNIRFTCEFYRNAYVQFAIHFAWQKLWSIDDESELEALLTVFN